MLERAWSALRRLPPQVQYAADCARTTTIAPLMDPLEYSRYARQLVAARPELREELELPEDQVIVTSAKTGEGIADLNEAIAGLISGTAA